MFATQSIYPSLMVFPLMDGKIEIVREVCAALRVEMIIVSWCSRGLSLIERNLKNWILLTKKSCIRRKTKVTIICGLWCATEDIPEDACSSGILGQALWRFDSIEMKQVTKAFSFYSCCREINDEK